MEIPGIGKSHGHRGTLRVSTKVQGQTPARKKKTLEEGVGCTVGLYFFGGGPVDDVKETGFLRSILVRKLGSGFWKGEVKKFVFCGWCVCVCVLPVGGSEH